MLQICSAPPRKCITRRPKLSVVSSVPVNKARICQPVWALFLGGAAHALKLGGPCQPLPIALHTKTEAVADSERLCQQRASLVKQTAKINRRGLGINLAIAGSNAAHPSHKTKPADCSGRGLTAFFALAGVRMSGRTLPPSPASGTADVCQLPFHRGRCSKKVWPYLMR